MAGAVTCTALGTLRPFAIALGLALSARDTGDYRDLAAFGISWLSRVWRLRRTSASGNIAGRYAGLLRRRRRKQVTWYGWQYRLAHVASRGAFML